MDEHKAIIPHNDLRGEVIDGHIYWKFPIGISIPIISLCFYSLDKIVDKLSLIPVVEEVMIKRRRMEIYSFDLISSIN